MKTILKTGREAQSLHRHPCCLLLLLLLLLLLCSSLFSSFLSFFLSFFEKTEMRKWFENNDSRSVVVFSISRNGFYKTLSAAFNKT